MSRAVAFPDRPAVWQMQEALNAVASALGSWGEYCRQQARADPDNAEWWAEVGGWASAPASDLRNAARELGNYAGEVGGGVVDVGAGRNLVEAALDTLWTGETPTGNNESPEQFLLGALRQADGWLGGSWTPPDRDPWFGRRCPDDDKGHRR
ncbi:MAG: hypothetical protein OXF62_17785 [Caldilineaceae bacterium]|nr:hypothetical protein [Caldilineaceae bacterium]